MRRSPNFLALQRKQLDARKELGRLVDAHDSGWIRTVRTALGMTSTQLGRRLGISQQAVAKLEQNERSGAITLASLARVAEQLDCDLAVVLSPKTSLEETVRRQATVKANDEHNRVRHTMRLEAQEQGVREVFDDDKAVDAWLTTRLTQLWD